MCYNVISKEVARVTAAEAVRRMKKQGWYLYEHGKKHDLYTHKKLLSKKYVEIPRHWNDELSKGVERDIITGMKEVENNMKGGDGDD